MSNAQSNRLLQILELEARETPAGALNWPVHLPQGFNTTHSVLSTYGQYLEQGGMHLHEGVDITVPEGTPVFAIQGGDVVAVNDTAPDPAHRFIVISLGVAPGTRAWNYLHLHPSKQNGSPWTVSDTINTGDYLGKVTPFPQGTPFPNHLHVDFAREPSDWNYGPSRTPVNDPRYFMTDYDTVRPAVASDVLFRVASDDKNGIITQHPSGIAGFDQLVREQESRDHSYFHVVDVDGRTVLGRRADVIDGNNVKSTGSAAIDVIANITDRATPNSSINGVYSVSFSIQGRTWSGSIGNVRSFTFANDFLDRSATPGLPLTGHHYVSFRGIELVRTIYENDWRANSVSWGDAWHIVTNTNSTAGVPDYKVSGSDRGRFWNTLVRSGGVWNQPSGANDAARNSESAFPDDFYSVTVTARDDSGNEGTRTVEIKLDNWQQTVATTKNLYSTLDEVTVSQGQEFRANEDVPLYVTTTNFIGGHVFGQNELKATARTNANGVIQQKSVGKFAAGVYYLMADYNRNGVYDVGPGSTH